MKKSFIELIKENKPKINIIKGRILGPITIKQVEYFLIDAALKSEGILPVNEVTDKQIGDIIDVSISGGQIQGYILMSHQKAKKDICFKKIRSASYTKNKIAFKITSVSEGSYKGLLLNEVFTILKTTEQLKVDDVVNVIIDKIVKNKFIQISLASENPNAKGNAQSLDLSQKFKEGDIVDCIAIKATEVLLKVSVGEYNGIIHFYDLLGVKNQEEANKLINQTIQAKILKIKSGYLILGTKQISFNAWSELKNNVQVGDKITATIMEVKPFGLVAKTSLGIEGFIHISELSWYYNKGFNMNNKYKVGDEINCAVVMIDLKKRRLHMSIKQTQEDPFLTFSTQYKISDIVEGTILNDPKTYGSFVFVNLIEGVDGVLHKSELSWNRDQQMALFDALKIGQKIKVCICNIDPEKKRVAVSVKKLNKDYFENAVSNITVGEDYSVMVIEISPLGLTVHIKDMPQCMGIIKKNEIPEEIRFSSFSIEDELKVKLIYVNKNHRLLFFSIKAFQSSQNKKAIQAHGNKSASLGFLGFLKK